MVIAVLLAFLTISPEHAGNLVTHLLAVLGGFLAGYVLVGVAGFFANRRLAKGHAPPWMLNLSRKIGGVIGALIVALIVFGGGGGNGPGPGDGPGPGGKPGTGTGSGTGPNPVTKPGEPETPTTAPTPEPTPAEDAIGVTVLAGSDVRDDRFYVLDGDAARRTLAEIKEAVATRKKAAGKPLAISIRLTPRTDRNNSGVRDLESWARESGMSVTFPKKA